MLITYRGVELQVCRFVVFAAKNITSEDGSDYLYTHRVIAAECIFNPSATASLGGTPNARTTAGAPGDSPTITEQSLREWLLQPRQALTVSVNNQVIIDSPAPLLDENGVLTRPKTDAFIGPKPIEVTVKQFIGYNSFRVYFAIETWMREDSFFYLSPMISNRWTLTETIDEHQYSTLHVEGVAVFRGDYLNFLQMQADQFRQSFIFRAHGSFKRKNLKVETDSTGLVVRYSFDDEQQTWMLKPTLFFTKFEGYCIIDDSATRDYDAVMAGLVGGATRGYFHRRGSGGAASVQGLAGLVSGAIASLPSTSATFVIDVYGTRFATRLMLASACIDMAIRVGFMPKLNQKIINGVRVPVIADMMKNSTRTISVDFPNRHAHGEFSLTASGVTGIFRDLNSLIQPLQAAAGSALMPVAGTESNIFRQNIGDVVAGTGTVVSQPPHYMALGAMDPNLINTDPDGPVRGFLDWDTPYWYLPGMPDGFRAQGPEFIGNYDLGKFGNDSSIYEWRSNNTRGPKIDYTSAVWQGDIGDNLRQFGRWPGPGQRLRNGALIGSMDPATLRLITQALADPLPDFSAGEVTSPPDTPTPLNGFPEEAAP